MSKRVTTCVRKPDHPVEATFACQFCEKQNWLNIRTKYEYCKFCFKGGVSRRWCQVSSLPCTRAILRVVVSFTTLDA